MLAIPERPEGRRKLRIRTAEVFEPLFQPARYKGAYGGRGSGKSWFFAEMLVDTVHPRARHRSRLHPRGSAHPHAVRKAPHREQDPGSSASGRCSASSTTASKRPATASSSSRACRITPPKASSRLEGFRVAWIEEAQTLSHRSLALLRPTIRVEGSEIWASWNPRRKSDAIDEFFRGEKPEGAIVVEANWRDNPWFTDVLEAERQLDLKR